ncbi:MAG TPA: CoA-binding protein [Acidocella sp.]|uniref:CoA-binding protein n=1 Tax=Acidocella sp. TaxID=50710 RepID=UPI002C06E58D|nr:CoA-binding protein [Acidocella sp.]HVE22450.1 CoA-binding protein [Acidocella sp.]
MTDAEIRDLLLRTRRIALVGASNKPARLSYHVMDFLLRQGFDVTPVNPGLAGQEILGQRVVASLDEAAPLDMVDLFRNSALVEEPVRDAIRLGAKSVWMQLGVINEDAARQAREAGLNVVMDRCPAIEIPRLGIMNG